MPPNSLADVWRWAREADQFLAEIEPARSSKSLINRTTRGITQTPITGPGSASGPSSTLQFKGFWDPAAAYSKGDIVIVDSYVYPDYGGTYIANDNVPPYTIIPGADLSSGAAGHTTLSGGGVASVVVDTAGFGYYIGQRVQFTGDGSGATAHVGDIIDSADGVTIEGVVSVVVDAPGTGYTTATPVFDSGVSLWAEFARGHWSELDIILQQRGYGSIIIASGGTSLAPRLVLMGVAGDSTAFCIDLDLALVSGKRIYPQELTTCEESGPMTRVFLCSDPF